MANGGVDRMFIMGKVLRDLNLNYNEDQENSTLGGSIDIEGLDLGGPPLMFIASINEGFGLVEFKINIVNIIPQDRRNAVAEFITRANFGVGFGALQMDFVDGLVGCQTYFHDKEISWNNRDEILRLYRVLNQIVNDNVTIAAHWFPSLMKVISGVLSPVQAFEEKSSN